MLAEATVAYLEKSGKGDLDRALAAVRKVRKLDPMLHESLFWEGADSVDFERSVREYDRCADRINEKYGPDTATKFRPSGKWGLNS
jgi:hypothetical protein